MADLPKGSLVAAANAVEPFFVNKVLQNRRR
jgi:hypothetical protein